MGFRTPSRFIKGVSTAGVGSVLGNLPVPNMFDPHVYANDFDDFTIAQWTQVQVGAGTNTIPAAEGGKLVLTTAAGGTDSQHLVKLPGTFSLTPGNQFWFMANVAVSNADSTMIVGMQPANAAPMVPVNGIFFSKTGGSANVDFTIRSASTSTTLSAVTTMAAATPTSLGFYYDGKQDPTLYVFSSTPVLGANPLAAFTSSPLYFMGGTCVGAMGAQSPNATPLTNLPLPAILMGPDFGILNTTANARTLTVDYVIAGSEVLRY